MTGKSLTEGNIEQGNLPNDNINEDSKNSVSNGENAEASSNVSIVAPPLVDGTDLESIKAAVESVLQNLKSGEESFKRKIPEVSLHSVPFREIDQETVHEFNVQMRDYSMISQCEKITQRLHIDCVETFRRKKRINK